MTDAEFEAYVDEGFKAPSKGKKDRKPHAGVWVPTDSLIRQLEKEGHQEGMSKGAARMNAVFQRIFKTTGQKTSPEAVKFLNDFDAAARKYAKANGIELRDDD